MDVLLFLYYRCTLGVCQRREVLRTFFPSEVHLLIQTNQNRMVYIKLPNMRYAHSVFTKDDIRSQVQHTNLLIASLCGKPWAIQPT